MIDLNDINIPGLLVYTILIMVLIAFLDPGICGKKRK